MREFTYRDTTLKVSQFTEDPESCILHGDKILGFNELAVLLQAPSDVMNRYLLFADVITTDPLRIGIEEALLGIRVSGLIGYLLSKGGK